MRTLLAKYTNLAKQLIVFFDDEERRDSVLSASDNNNFSDIFDVTFYNEGIQVYNGIRPRRHSRFAKSRFSFGIIVSACFN